MLVKLFGKNYRCFKDDFELSMIAADLTNEDDKQRGYVALELDGATSPLCVLRVAAILGPNASGKSTVLKAAEALHSLAIRSSSSNLPSTPLNEYTPFLLDDASENEPTELGCDVYHDKSVLRYQLKFSRSEIIEECLTRVTGVGEVSLIERDATGEVAGELIKVSEVNKLYVKEMQPNVSVLSKLAQHGPRQGPESVVPFYQAINGALQFRDYGIWPSLKQFWVENKFAVEEPFREWVTNRLMRAADVGIVGATVRTMDHEILPEYKETFSRLLERREIPEKNTVVSFVHGGERSQFLNFSAESNGTRKLFCLSVDLHQLTQESTTIFADELSAGLHPLLVRQLVAAINGPVEHAPRSQLIFATHETSLMDGQDGLPPPLRRDQVFFTRKDIKGASELYSLVDFRVSARPVHNLRKRYLTGLYGAVPQVEGLLK